ncbi:MAG TPA: iron-containing redox enzyme family protein [Jatrophihabitantaceae bacterium]|nr:iron-containing redox enzyme family protein [Jatrophihabitantaceae bacterium]
MLLPEARGALSGATIDLLTGRESAIDLGAVSDDPIADDDLQLALWICYELHYRGFECVDDGHEWSPQLIAFRGRLEEALLSALRRDVPVPDGGAPTAQRLREIVDADDGPQLSRYLQTDANREQYLEFAVHRSIYQLKEADPHTWVIPRLSGRAKAALVSIQTDEYGDGEPSRVHSELYRTLLRGFGLSDDYGYYVHAVPGITLAISNVMSLFGLHRELRGACVGHLAAYEMTSSVPCRRYARGARRIGADDATCRFFDEHVTADALHEQFAMHDLCGGLAEAEPELEPDILFGAAACLYIDARFATHVLDAWANGRSSLLRPMKFGDPPRSQRLRAVS